MKKEPVFIFGAGGHAVACIEVLEAEGKFRILGLVGRKEEVGRKVSGYSVVGTDKNLPALLKKTRNLVMAIGQIKTPAPRARLFLEALSLGAKFPVVRSPFSRISPRAVIGAGTIVMHGVVVQAGAVVGRNCILNSCCLVEHGVQIGDHCHVSTGAILNGDVVIGSGSFVGSGAVLQEGVRLKDDSLVPMGQMVRRPR